MGPTANQGMQVDEKPNHQTEQIPFVCYFTTRFSAILSIPKFCEIFASLFAF